MVNVICRVPFITKNLCLTYNSINFLFFLYFKEKKKKRVAFKLSKSGTSSPEQVFENEINKKKGPHFFLLLSKI